MSDEKLPPCVGIVYDERMLLHSIHGHNTDESTVDDNDGIDNTSVDSDFPHGHPECPQRIESIFDALNTPHIMSRCRRIEANCVSYDDVVRVHDHAYVKYMQAADGVDKNTLEQKLTDSKCTFGTEFHNHEPEEWNGGSVYMNEHTIMAARVAAGGVVQLVREVCDPTSSVKSGFAVVRPPGHHAEPGCCMGFSIFNNIAIAARVARDELGCQKVLIVDWDVHHGNGTQHMFLEVCMTCETRLSSLLHARSPLGFRFVCRVRTIL